MNKTLFLASMKANWKLWLGMFFVLVLYQSIIIGMYDPKSAEGMAAMVETLPPGIVSAFGFNGLSTDLTNHMGTYLYGFLFLVFPLIYIVPAANNLIARHIDRGSMVYLLATPNTRQKIVLTQAIFLYVSTFLLMAFSVLMGILIAELMFPGELMVGNYLLLNLVTIAVHLILCGIAFLASCSFSESKPAVSMGIGIPVAFLMLKMLSAIGDKLGALKYFTIFSFIDTARIFSDHAYAWWSSLIMLAAATLLMIISVRVFDKRSMNI